MVFQKIKEKKEKNCKKSTLSSPQAGRVGNGQKPEQRLPKSRTKWAETQGGARRFSGAFAFGTKALPRLEAPHLERLCGRPMFLA